MRKFWLLNLVWITALVATDAQAGIFFRRRNHCHECSGYSTGRPVDSSARPYARSEQSPGIARNQSAVLTLPAEKLSASQKELRDYLANDESGKQFLRYWKYYDNDLSVTQAALLFAVREAGSKIIRGKSDPTLCASADRVAVTMSQEKSGARKPTVSNDSDVIKARSFSDSGEELMKHARACVKQWQQVPAETRTVMSFHNRFCFAMRKSEDGSYACTAKVAD